MAKIREQLAQRLPAAIVTRLQRLSWLPSDPEPSKNGTMGEPAKDHLPDLSRGREEWTLLYPYPARATRVKPETHGLFYEAAHTLLKELGISRDEHPEILIVDFDRFKWMNGNAFFFPHLDYEGHVSNPAHLRSDKLEGRGAIVIGTEYLKQHTVETLLNTVAHEAGHALQWRADPNGPYWHEHHRQLRSYCSYRNMPPYPGVKKYSEAEYALSRVGEAEADAVASGVMGGILQEQARRCDEACVSDDLTLTDAETKKEKTASHPHIKRRILAAREVGNAQTPITLVRRDGGVVER